MRQVFAIAKQTFWEGVRMRVVLVSIIVLAILIVRLPFAMRGDETLTGRLQAFLAYSFGSLGLFASLATVFFSCATLANEIKNCQMHLVVTKPVTRFRILAGKWLGVNLLNVMLVLICSAAIYLFARHIVSREAPFERDRMQLDNVVWTARDAAFPIAPDFSAEINRTIDQHVADGRYTKDSPSARQSAYDKRIELTAQWRTMKPGEGRVFEFKNLRAPDNPNEAMQVRFRARANPLPPEELVPLYWALLDADSKEPLGPPTQTNGRSGDVIQFLFRGQAAIKDGKAALAVLNAEPDGTPHEWDVSLEGDDWLQIMYKVGSFEANFARNVVMILSRLAFLSAIGLLFGVFVSFPVACLCTFATYLIGSGWDWWFKAIGAEMEVYSVDVDPYGRFGPFVRFFLEPIMRAFPNFVKYNGTTRLIAGELIPDSTMLWCLGQTIVLGGLLLLTVGWLVFQKKEIAEITV